MGELKSEVETWRLMENRVSELLELSELAIKEARAEAHPDVSLGAGYIRKNEIDEDSFVLQLSVGLPLFDRNQGAVEEAKLISQAATHDMTSLKADLRAELFEKHSELKGLVEQLAVLEQELLPMAEEAYDQILSFYRAGKSSYIDVLELRRDLIGLRSSVIETRTEMLLLAVDIEEMTGLELVTIR